MNKPMIANTNILVRLFVKDDDTQIEQLVRLIEQGDTRFYILSLVIIEAYWVLRKVYGFEKIVCIVRPLHRRYFLYGFELTSHHDRFQCRYTID